MNAPIGIIGHFGGQKEFFDGQTVKTKVLYQELKQRGYEIIKVDTYYNQLNKIKLLFDTIKCVFKCKTIILLVSGNGMRIYFPFLYIAKKILRRKVFHDVIGGNLAEYVDKYPKYKKYLNSFNGNWVEFNQLKLKLEERGIQNCVVIPNFKNLNVDAAHIKIEEPAKHRLCMFSRVMKEKGVTKAIKTVHNYNVNNDFKFFLDIWGPIDEQYSQEFQELLELYQEDCKYFGVVDYDKSVEVLTNHIALLFPTFWNGEGFPGTIVDAYAAAVPVVASNWNANMELIDNFKTGWVYPNNKCVNLEESLKWISSHIDELCKMRICAKKKAKEFMPKCWIDLIIEYIR